MAKRTAEDLIGIIGEAAEDLKDRARMEARKDCADALADLVKKPGDVADYLLAGTYTTPLGSTVECKSYLPGVDPETFKVTPDFIQGLRFAINLLRNAAHEF